MTLLPTARCRAPSRHTAGHGTTEGTSGTADRLRVPADRPDADPRAERRRDGLADHDGARSPPAEVVRLDWAIPCRYAEATWDGTATLVGAGADSIFTSSLPREAMVFLMLRFAGTEDEFEAETRFEVRVVDPASREQPVAAAALPDARPPLRLPGAEIGMLVAPQIGWNASDSEIVRAIAARTASRSSSPRTRLVTSSRPRRCATVDSRSLATDPPSRRASALATRSLSLGCGIGDRARAGRGFVLCDKSVTGFRARPARRERRGILPA